MRRFAGALLIVLALPLLAAAALLVALNTDPGRRVAERLTAHFSGGMVVLDGLAGRFPDRLRVARVEVRDTHGVWLTVRDAALDWTPSGLLARDAHVTRLTAAAVQVARPPVSASSEPASGPGFRLPVRVDVDTLHVDRVELAPAVAGAAAALSLDGSAHLNALNDGAAEATLRPLAGSGLYHASGRIDAAGLAVTLDATEPPHGLAASLAGLPDLGALSLTASAHGPWSAAAVKLAAGAGELRASATGTVNVTDNAADLDVTANAPAMTPRADVSWQAVALDAHLHGPFTRPQASGTLRVDALAAAGATLRRLSADIAGNQGQLNFTASAQGVRLPGPRPDLLEASPVSLQAHAQLDAADRPVTFTLAHKLLSLRGTAQTGGELRVQAHADVPDLAPLAAIGGIALSGASAFDVTAAQTGDATRMTLDGTLGLTGGMAPLPELLGMTRFGVTAALHGSDVALDRLQVDGRALTLAGHGGLTGGVIALDWNTALSDLSALAPTLRGKLAASGHVQGTTDNFAVQAEATGDVATAGVPSGPLKLSVSAAGLPGAPSGKIVAEGTLDGAPLGVDATAQRQPDGALHLSIGRAEWKSARAEGAFSLAPGATLPLGKLTLRLDRLDDLRRLLGQPVAGSVDASIDMAQDKGRTLASVKLTARNAGLPGTAEIALATLDARVADPTGEPDLDAKLDVTGLRASGIAGGAQVQARGRLAALAMRMQAALRGVAGADVDASGMALLDVPGKKASVSALQANWKGETLRLLAPVRVAFGDGVAVDRLRLGLRDAVLEVAGRMSPTLDATASLRNVTADLARIVTPDLKADGMMQADAKLTGSLARPTGRVHVAATGLHMRSGPAASLPPGAITADATLNGASAAVQAHAAVGRNAIDVSGTAPIAAAAAMNLRATGGVDLALLDPLLSARGQRVRGRIALDATVTGTLAAPRADGTLRLAGGEVQDFAQGAHITDIQALIQASGETVRIASFTGRAGSGTVAATGSIGLGGARPVDLRVTASNASPLSSDRLTAALDMDLTLRGELAGQLALGGSMRLDRADIRIPERLPARVVVLDVRRPGDAPPPPAATAGPAIGLDVTLSAPGQVFVRGRGLFAELQGRIHVTGTAAAPQPSGKFELRRGEFNLAGRTLTFTTGEVGFDGSGRIDPTLNFIASSTTGSSTSTLAVTGYASAPKITLSSVPELPQDEVLAQLLFHENAASLSGFQLAEAAAALAQLSGVGGGVFDPLNSVRQKLGLDRLSVGGAQTGNGASVEAGRYVARGVYVGAKQATSGAGTQATVQVDLYRGLKLETNVGTGGATSTTGSAADSSGTSVGLTYRFDY